MRFRPLSLVATVLLSAVAGSSAFAALGQAGTDDRGWTSPDAARVPLRRIALLPVIDVTGGQPARERAVEAAWLARFGADGHEWVTPDTCRRSLAAIGPRKPDSVLSAIRPQVLRTGRLDAQGSRLLAEALHVQALLTVRIDRWDRVVAAAPRAATTVALTAALVDSTGRLLWRASGSQRVFTGDGAAQSRASNSSREGEAPTAPKYEGPKDRPGGVADPGFTIGLGKLEPKDQGLPADPATELAPREFHAALAQLLERWSAGYPYRGARAPTSPSP